MLYTCIVLLGLFSYCQSGCVTCPNQCSGHGTCGLNFVCSCYDNYGMGLSHDSGDCSERICPYELAWVDTPDVYGRRHKYAECAGRGVCNRDTAECECFAGYEGKACARTTCPNDCSGHGRCAYIEDLSFGASPFDYAEGDFTTGLKTFPYYWWDNQKTRGCVCDPGFGDADCSKRVCPYGTDVMAHRPDMLLSQSYQTQMITLVEENVFWDATLTNAQLYAHDQFKTTGGLEGKTFALTFKSKLNETFTTIPIYLSVSNFPQFLADVQNALKGLPNKVIDDVQVHGSTYGTNEIYLNISFTGEAVQGSQYLLEVQSALCGDGCTPKLTGLELHPRTQNVTEVSLADFNSYECGRRGKCDYGSGICSCFEGYTGVACSTITALI